jgi:ABC-2 type transport system permease protein
MWKFIRYELKYWTRTPMIWIFMFIYALFAFFATASDNVVVGGGSGNIFRNAPFQIQNYYNAFSIICLLMTTAFMNATANRDFEFGMHQFVFSSPIRKRDYFFGKFIGAAIIAAIPAIGISIGTILAPPLAAVFDMAPQDRFGDIYWSAHLLGILEFALPNAIISGVFLFSLAILFRSTIVSFVGSMLLLVFYIISSTYTRDIQTEWLANLLDPFGSYPFENVTKYLTVAERNFQVVPFEGGLLMNRLIWLGVAITILFGVYLRFSFNTRKEKAPKEKSARKSDAIPFVSNTVFSPTKPGQFSLGTFWNLIKFETRSIVKNPVYIIIMSIGLIILIVNFATFTSSFGTKRYAVTYLIVDNIVDAYAIFLYGFIAFYTGVVVWKERDAKINEIQDATPIQSGMLFVSKLIAIVMAIALVFLVSILLGIITQTLYGYTRYEIDVYIKGLFGIRLVKMIFLTVLSLLLHYLINNRYIAWFAFIAFIIVNGFIWGLLEIRSNMLAFGFLPEIEYSDMNGYGPFVPGSLWFSLYWSLFCLILCFVITAFYIRGKEEQFRYRWAMAKTNFWNKKLAIGISVLLFVLCGSFVYYNTKILNTYESSKESENKQVEYEKKYKKYENLTQPRFYKLDYKIDVFPESRSVKTNVDAWARNISSKPITELHFTMPELTDSVKISIPNAKIKTNDTRLFYQIYTLDKPLMPGDSIKINVALHKENPGFENEVSFSKLTQNGTFFNNTDIMPSFGYNKDYELSEKNKRAKLKLPKRERMPKLDDNNMAARANCYVSNDADYVYVTTTISTTPDQIAIAPGSLVKSWSADGRKYFNYKLDKKALNFYSFISAKYEVARRKWNGIDLEVYYDKQHAYNVPNMLNSMQKSLDYYTKNFGPYYHKQCRIIEFPRYESFAQAFPGTMPYSEAVGFITDLRHVKQDDIDMVFYIVAHEMGHQYWAHQVCGANMQGSEMMSEGFAQYSALMVMEKEYGRDKMKKFLEYEMDEYLSGRRFETEAERPLMKTENQQYIHYQKASVVLYYFKEMIGEQKVNQALKNLVDTYAYKSPPYPTSNAAIAEFRKVTPDSLQYLIHDLFETITLFNNRTLEAKYKKIGSEYEVKIKASCEKFRCDSLGTETKIPISDYIDVAIFAQPKDDAKLGKVLVKKRVKVTKKDNVFTFRTKEIPYQAGVDPYNYLIDRVTEDNIKQVEE